MFSCFSLLRRPIFTRYVYIWRLIRGTGAEMSGLISQVISRTRLVSQWNKAKSTLQVAQSMSPLFCHKTVQ